MTHPLKWNEGDRCQHGNRKGVIKEIRNTVCEIATVEFDDEPFVLVDVEMSELYIIIEVRWL